ncbi:MAG: penicillin-binding protein 2 [Coriobacteriales bacterium]|nr:penicillin-binding protein 2 [Coriobacteriales bacterium]
MLALVAVAGRLVYLQVFAAPAYAARAAKQRVCDLQIPPRRGVIYDREGEPLAVSVDAKTVYATPAQIRDKRGTAQALAKTLGGSAKDYLPKLQKDTGFVYIARKVDLEKADALEALELDGIRFQDDSRRVYPSSELACQVLGFVGVDDEGLAGIEARYDRLLAGVPGVLNAERDPWGRPIPGGVMRAEDPVDGESIVLTIDKDIQYKAQLELAAAVDKWGAESGSIIVMSPRTGEIYAMYSTPGFNPNAYRTANSKGFRNKPVCDAYEPGSTMKSLTAAAAIDKGIYKPSSKLVLPPTIQVGGRTIHESHGRGTVEWSLRDIVTNSSNVGAVKVGMRLGEKGLYKYFKKFGLTEPTGVDFPGEGQGFLPPVSQWSSSSIGNIPFGQGVSTTPLQLARAISGIANDGVLPTPHLLLSVPDRPNAVPTWESKRAITVKASHTTTRMLQSVVTSGTGTEAAVAGYTVAGKTGTAQKVSPGGGYADGEYVGSFIGYLPAEDPQVLVCVTIDEPSEAIYGGTVAAPTFSSVAAFSVAHLKIPPSSAAVDRTPGPGGGKVTQDR